MIKALFALGLVRMIEVVWVLVEEGGCGLTLAGTSTVVVVILEEVEAPSMRWVRGTCCHSV